jgi:hypothetical protein
VANSPAAVLDPPRASRSNVPLADQIPAAAASGADPVAATSPTRRGLPTLPHQQAGAAEAPQVWPPGFDFLGMPVELPKPDGSIAAVEANPLQNRTTRPLVDPTRGNDMQSRAAIHDLLPVPAPVIGQPGGSRRDPGAASGARVSIGTIEVTVVPPPAPAVRDVPTPAHTAPSRPRAGSALAPRPASDRLRDSLRRWYGTAQG